MIAEVSKGKPVGPGATMESLTKVMKQGMVASRRFRRSMEELKDHQDGLTGKQVCDIFKSQAQLNQINLAWNSFTSLSLIHNQEKVKQLEETVSQQSEEIEAQGYRLEVHQQAIRRLFGALHVLGQKYQRLSEGQGRALGMLRVLQAQVMVAISSQRTQSISVKAADMLRGTLAFFGRYGLLALICDWLLSMTQISGLLRFLTSQLVVGRRNASRVYGATKASAILALILVVRKRFEKVLSLLSYLLKTLINNTPV